jgi:hypothetical protein
MVITWLIVGAVQPPSVKLNVIVLDPEVDQVTA